jgi:hypothetical protein
MIEFASRENRMFNGHYTTDPLRVALSLIVGSATYVILMVLRSFWSALGNPGLQNVLDHNLRHPFFFAVFFVIWGVFLIIFGLPLGLLLHKLRLRHWLVAVVAGGAMTFLVFLGFVALLSEFILPIVTSPSSGGPSIFVNPVYWWGALRNALILGVEGAAVALVMWRIAYRRAAL